MMFSNGQNEFNFLITINDSFHVPVSLLEIIPSMGHSELKFLLLKIIFFVGYNELNFPITGNSSFHDLVTIKTKSLQ